MNTKLLYAGVLFTLILTLGLVNYNASASQTNSGCCCESCICDNCDGNCEAGCECCCATGQCDECCPEGCSCSCCSTDSKTTNVDRFKTGFCSKGGCCKVK